MKVPVPIRSRTGASSHWLILTACRIPSKCLSSYGLFDLIDAVVLMFRICPH